MQIEKLILEQKKTEAIIYSIEDGLVMTDYQGKIQLMNKSAKRIFAIPATEELLGKALWEVPAHA